MALGLLVLHFEIRQHRLAPWAPVHHVFAAVNQPSLPQADEYFAHRARQAGVHGEALAAPVTAHAHADHLALDGVAVLLLPLPDALDEFLAADLIADRKSTRLNSS